MAISPSHTTYSATLACFTRFWLTLTCFVKCLPDSVKLKGIYFRGARWRIYFTTDSATLACFTYFWLTFTCFVKCLPISVKHRGISFWGLDGVFTLCSHYASQKKVIPPFTMMQSSSSFTITIRHCRRTAWTPFRITKPHMMQHPDQWDWNVSALFSTKLVEQ